ncbi:conserved hypothetical protein [Xenorhabdus nematophila ATCC 19061]|nr:conserved hypothetical protein [Xenorhabdus nematophila ATCC 19061]
MPQQIFRCAGLSPYLRGTPFENVRGKLIVRFIPVLTGNTSLPEQFFDNNPVYPRTYGEHSFSLPIFK